MTEAPIRSGGENRLQLFGLPLTDFRIRAGQPRGDERPLPLGAGVTDGPRKSRSEERLSQNRSADVEVTQYVGLLVLPSSPWPENRYT